MKESSRQEPGRVNGLGREKQRKCEREEEVCSPTDTEECWNEVAANLCTESEVRVTT